jgi:hypothetical protein
VSLQKKEENDEGWNVVEVESQKRKEQRDAALV